MKIFNNPAFLILATIVVILVLTLTIQLIGIHESPKFDPCKVKEYAVSNCIKSNIYDINMVNDCSMQNDVLADCYFDHEQKKSVIPKMEA